MNKDIIYEIIVMLLVTMSSVCDSEERDRSDEMDSSDDAAISELLAGGIVNGEPDEVLGNAHFEYHNIKCIYLLTLKLRTSTTSLP